MPYHNLTDRMKNGDPEFVGKRLLRLVVDIEAAIGMNMAGMTPLGRAVTELCEETMDATTGTAEGR